MNLFRAFKDTVLDGFSNWHRDSHSCGTCNRMLTLSLWALWPIETSGFCIAKSSGHIQLTPLDKINFIERLPCEKQNGQDQ